MHANKEAFAPLDPGRIHKVDPVERACWGRQLGCSAKRRDAAVAAVGAHPTAVRDWLARPTGRWPPRPAGVLRPARGSRPARPSGRLLVRPDQSRPTRST